MIKLIVSFLILVLFLSIVIKPQRNKREIYVTYEPNKWNQNKYIQHSHNCYQYALDDIDHNLKKKCEKQMKKINNCLGMKSSPGHYSNNPKYIGLEKKTANCKVMSDSILADNPEIYIIKNDKKCKKDYYKIAVAIKPGETYHFWRQDDHNLWSHKDGGTPAKNRDESNKLIKDPKYADRGQYSDFCNYFCVPENYKSKTNYDRH